MIMMTAQILYLLIGIIGVVVFSVQNSKNGKKVEAKSIVGSCVTVILTVIFMYIFAYVIFLVSANMVGGMTSIVLGCIGDVAVPLIIALGSMLLIGKIFGRKQSGLLITGIVAAVCLILGCILDGVDLVEQQKLIEQMMSGSGSFFDIFMYQPKFTYIVKILVLVPAIVRLVLTAIDKNNQAN